MGVTLTFATESLDDVDALAERARGRGARIVSEPTNQPWNARDFSVADPDGFRLTFTYGPVNADLGIEEVVAGRDPR